MSTTKPKLGNTDTFIFHKKNAQDEYRWTRKSRNGRVVGASTEGYTKRQMCIDNAKRNGYDPQVHGSHQE
jgi:uncharacterized protein YegP (UPF0339 family)